MARSDEYGGGAAAFPAKVRIPARALVPRPTLAAAFARARDARLLLVQAPAGHGKTCALQQYATDLRRDGGRAAWLTLDPADRDPSQLSAHLILSLEAAGWRKPLPPRRARDFRPHPIATMPLRTIIEFPRRNRSKP